MPTRAPRRCFREAPFHPDLQAGLLRDLDTARQTAPLTPLRVLVPQPRLGPHLAQAAAAAGLGPLPLQFFSWPELAATLTAAARWGEERQRLAPAGAATLARWVLGREKRPPGFFAQALDQRGFRAAMLRCFDGLAAAGLVRARTLERFLLQHGADLGPRLRHVFELAIGQRRSFESHFDDDAALLERAAGLEPPHLSLGGRLWIYGFEALNVLERRLLLTLARDEEVDLEIYCPRGAATRLVDWLQEEGFQPVPVPAAPPAAAVEMQILSAPGEEAEAREVARRLLRAADREVPFDRMAVVTRTAAALPLLAETLERTGVPITAPTLFSLASRRSGRALSRLLDLADGEFATTPVLEFLLLVPARWQEWAGIAADPVPSAWERVARRAGLGVGIEAWRRQLMRERQALLDSRPPEAEAPSRTALAAAAACAELAQVAEALVAELRRFPARARWSEFAALTAECVERVFVDTEETRALRAALAALAALDALPAPRPSRSDFREALRHLLGEARVPAPASRPGGVTLGTAEELYGLDFDVLCLAGLQEGEWPGPVAEDPVLPDRDRAVVGDKSGLPGALPLRADQLERQRWLFQAASAGARRQLVLGYARLDPATGAARLPSELLLELAEGREGRRLDYEDFARLSWCERVPLRRRETPSAGPILSLEEFDDIAVAALPPPAARRYVRLLGPGPARGLALAASRQVRRRFTAFDGLLADAALRSELAGRVRSQPFSASQLALYSTCPFKFFLRQQLRLEPLEREERREPSALEVGILVHRILEAFHRGLESDDVDFEAASFATLRERLLQAASTCFAAREETGAQRATLLWDIRKQQLRDDLVRFLRQERQRAAEDPGWVPWRFEFAFGPEGPVSPAVQRGADALRLRGKIDRIDRHLRHPGLRVVDYKSGRARAGKREPGAVQLVLYLLAASRGDTACLEHSEGRFVHVTRRGGFEVQRLAGTRVLARRADFDTLVREVAAGIEAGEFFPQPGENGVHCRACDYRGLCDARIQRLVQRKSASRQDARWQALPDFGLELQTLGKGTEDDD